MNSKITLFVLAAGMGSRYGGIKQMVGFGPNGETIMDYSLYDAVRCGFDKVVFVIRPDMEKDFKEMFVEKYKGKIDIQYTFQTVDMLPDWYKLNPERVKPWGTGHALLCSKDLLDGAFALINGDDFYGRESFEIVAKFLREKCDEKNFCFPAYKLKNVLSEAGGVKRGICKMNGKYLEDIQETFEVIKNGDGSITGETVEGDPVVLTSDDLVSMNMFGLHSSMFEKMGKMFDAFLKNNKDPLKGEFLLPVVLGMLIKGNGIKIEGLETNAQWFGVTYQEDGPEVKAKLKELVDKGVYPAKLVI
ncbi:MAG: NTP transferase domain-containing protein [Candidatus Dojkabacteria bacterium]|nr:NTP transferase domain-containing protein [Candidatus Dojkabacteria bacterium]